MTISLRHYKPEAPRAWPVPFVVRSGDFLTVDGDTIALLGAGEGRNRPVTMRVRFRSANAAETRDKGRSPERVMLTRIGVMPGNGAGQAASRALSGLTAGRSIVIVPSGRDRWGRLLGDVWVSGCAGRSFGMAGAFSVENEMIRRGHMVRRRGQDAPCDAVHDIGRALQSPVPDEKMIPPSATGPSGPGGMSL